MDVLKSIEEKAFWGHEFLTWLWWRSEEAGGDLELDGFGPLGLWIEDRMVLGSLDTESKENTLKDGDVSRSGEAATGLKVGKKVLEARFGLVREDREWSFTLKGDSLDLTSAKIPKVLTEEGDDWHATALVRLGHVREALDLLDGLFAEFVRARVAPTWDREVVPDMGRWIGEKDGG